MLPQEDESCDNCTAKALYARQSVSASLLFSSLPFAFTFVVVASIVLQRLFPLLSRVQSGKSVGHTFSALSWRGRAIRDRIKTSFTSRNVAAITSSVTIASAAVLTELILCEISDLIDKNARKIALRIIVDGLLALLILLIPLLEIHSVVCPTGYGAVNGKRRLQLRQGMEVLAFVTWLTAFWWLGRALPGIHEHNSSNYNGLVEACLERVGTIGIALMALLSGFGATSSLWQSFGVRQKQVTEADISRKQAGLEATNSMLSAKRSRLVQVERKLAEAASESIWQKAIGSIRGNTEVQERKALTMEISGLETMALSLNSSITLLQKRHRTQLSGTTSVGRLFILSNKCFSVYCFYRILATLLTTFHRWWSPSTSFSGTDPITHILALVAKHFDPDIDRIAWSQQISFLFSGFMFMGSFSAVLQTFHFLTRYTPFLLRTAQTNLALLVSQICGMYVISSALLLRSMMPKEVGSVINDALGTAVIESVWVDKWFESWFLGAVGVTAVGIWIGKKVGDAGEWDDESWDDDIELGKRN